MTLRKDPEEAETSQLKRAVDLAGRSVLEVGCGNGRLTWRYARYAGSVSGIDPDIDELKIAMADCPVTLGETVSFARANALALPFPPDTFDITILAWSF